MLHPVLMAHRADLPGPSIDHLEIRGGVTRLTAEAVDARGMPILGFRAVTGEAARGGRMVEHVTRHAGIVLNPIGGRLVALRAGEGIVGRVDERTYGNGESLGHSRCLR